MLKARSKKTVSIFLLLAAFCLLPLSCENPLIQKILEYKTVSFNTNGGSSVPDQSLIKGWKITRPDDPVKLEFVFDGWYEDNDTFMYEWDFDNVPAADMILHAKWIDDERIQITFAAVTVTVPVTDHAPDTAAEPDTTEGEVNFSVGDVSWSPYHDLFWPGMLYTASVMLTANEGYSFTGLTSAAINGHEAKISDNTGDTVTLSLTFGATEAKDVPVREIAVEAQPTKLVYNEGETLDLSGLIVLITYDDGISYSVHFEEFSSMVVSITTSPEHGVELNNFSHNDSPVIVTLGEYHAQTVNLTVYPTYTVTFKLNNGAADVVQTVLREGKVSPPNASVPEGLYAQPDVKETDLNITYWHDEEGEMWSFDTPITKNKDFYANWNISPVDLSGQTGNLVEQALAYIGSNPLSGNNTGYTLLINKDYTAGPHTIDNNRNITIAGLGQERTITYNGEPGYSLFKIDASSGTSASLTLGNNINLRGSTATNNASALISVINGTLIMEKGSKITGHTNSNEGGGVYIGNGGTFTMNGGEISGNKSKGGGGVYVNSGTFTMTGGTISKNEAHGDGGGVYIGGGTFNMSGSAKVSGNTAEGSGGGVYVNGWTTIFNMTGGTVGGTGQGEGNTANSGGGGVCVDSTGTFKMEGGEVSGNTANSGGGVNLVDGSTFNMSGGVVSGNEAAFFGGGIFLSGFGNNTFDMSGGAVVAANNDVYLSESRQITVTGALSGTEPVATIRPASYSKGREVVVLGASATGTTLENAAAKFAVKPNGSDSDWYVDGEGKLATVDMKSVTGGSFQMGNTAGGGKTNELPVHTVTLTQVFSMSKYQVTQEQYQRVMTDNTNGINATPSSFKTDADDGEIQNRRPVENVSWYEALVFCNRLSTAEGLTPAYRIANSTDPSVWGTVPESLDSTWSDVVVVPDSTGYRLPTEAQWEYAAKGGPSASSPYKVYSGSDDVNDVAWWGDEYGNSGNSGGKTHEVGQKAPNELAIYDMSGNVWEWCWDLYGDYPTTSQTDPLGASSGTDRVMRGGGWQQPEAEVRSECRGDKIPPYFRAHDIGFRVLRPLQ